MSKQGDENVRKDQVLDYPLSQKVAELTRAEKYHCWHNALDAVRQLPGLFLLSTYTEGWLVVPKEQVVQVIEHGWITHSGGHVVDPSIVLLEEQGQDLAYFPALDLPWPDAYDLPRGVPLPVAHLLSPNGDELGHPAYRAAYNAALAYAETRAAEMGSHVQICPAEKIIVVLTKEGDIVILE